MPPDTAAGRLERARAGIRQALAGWNATDLEQVDASRELLAAAVDDLRAFEAAVLSGRVLPTPELRAAILAVKKDVVQATRVVDACVAFQRGLAARTGATPPVYDAAGHLTGESDDLEPEVHA